MIWFRVTGTLNVRHRIGTMFGKIIIQNQSKGVKYIHPSVEKQPKGELEHSHTHNAREKAVTKQIEIRNRDSDRGQRSSARQQAAGNKTLSGLCLYFL